MFGVTQQWIRVPHYRPMWKITDCHTNYAILSIKGGWLVWAVYGNSEPERKDLQKYPWYGKME